MRNIKAFIKNGRGKNVTSLVEVVIGHSHQYQAIQPFQPTKQRYPPHHNEG